MKLDLSFLHRKKRYNEATMHETNLDRVLGLVDITALGVSCTLGNGIYVLAGEVIANYAGASIVLSFIVAGLATFIAGICYAEFGARVPRSGSAYVYIYVSIGEFVAFILGWDLILEYVIGVSSGASALSRYIDSLAGNVIQNALRSSMPMNYESLAPYPDFLSFGFVILITIFMIVGVKESSLLNKLFTLLNIVVIGFIFVSGVFKADLANWELDPKTIPNWTDFKGNNQSCLTSTRCGNGGFLTYGFSGVIQGAAKCFYAYIGFDTIASTGEEVQNPKRNLPLSIVLTLIIVSLCYCSVSVVLTLMLPYYLIDPDIPLPQAYEYVGMGWAQTLVSVGAIASLITCLYASMFPMPRVVYSLASDGLIFKWLSILMPRLKTPVTAALASGLFAAILSLIFDLSQLIDMMSIGTLMAYSVVAVCVLILRYRPPEETIRDQEEVKKMLASNGYNSSDQQNPVANGRQNGISAKSHDEFHLAGYIFGYSDEPLMRRFFRPESKRCNKLTSRLVNVLVLLSVVYVFVMSLLLTIFQNSEQLEHTEYIMLGVTVVLFALTVVNSVIISQQPQDETISSFKIPLISFLPFVSVFINLYLMMALSLHTWIRFGVWFLLGIIVYFSYGVRNSLERQHVVKLKDTNPS